MRRFFELKLQLNSIWSSTECQCLSLEEVLVVVFLMSWRSRGWTDFGRHKIYFLFCTLVYYDLSDGRTSLFFSIFID